MKLTQPAQRWLSFRARPAVAELLRSAAAVLAELPRSVGRRSILAELLRSAGGGGASTLCCRRPG